MKTQKIIFFLCITLCATIPYILNVPFDLNDTILTEIEAVVTCVAEQPWQCDGFTPLMIAAMRGNIESPMQGVPGLKELIAEGVPLDTLSGDEDQSATSSNDWITGNTGKKMRNTALHIAIYNTNFVSNFSAAHMLINAGANVRVANSDGDTPMHFMMQRIYRKGVFDQTHLSQREGQLPSVPENTVCGLSEREALMINLIVHGADINAQNNQGYTMLHIAVLDNEGQWIKRLIDKYGSIIDFTVKAFPSSCKTLTHLEGTPFECGDCLTPLQLAGVWAGNCTGNTNVRDYFENNNYKSPKILGANDMHETLKMTGLMLAVIWEGSQKLKNPTYDASLDVNDPHKEYTVDKLLPSADLNLVTQCAFTCGSNNGCQADVNLNNTVLHVALLHQVPDMVLKILDGAKKLGRSIDVNKQNASGNVPLHYVLKLYLPQLYEAQKRAGINLDVYNKESRTKVVQALMDSGANINIRNNNGDTLLHLAVKDHATDLIRYILEGYYIDAKPNASRSPNLDIVNKSGKTIMNLAQSLQYEDIVNVIQEAINKRESIAKK